MRHLMFYVVFIALSVFPALTEARSWSFSKDTVSEWGKDTVQIWNKSDDTVHIDSMILYGVKPNTAFAEVADVALDVEPGAPIKRYHIWSIDILEEQERPFLRPQSLTKLSGFEVTNWRMMVLRAQASSSKEDTVLLRMVFYAKTERDTLMVWGQMDTLMHGSGIRKQNPSFPQKGNLGEGRFDALGRLFFEIGSPQGRRKVGFLPLP